jgi:hypothetical protein
MQNTVWAQLFRESVIFQGAIAVIALIGTFTLLFLDRPVPEFVWIMDGTVIGFFFGARNLLTARNSAQEANKIAEILAVQNAQIVKALSTMGVGGPIGDALQIKQ